MAQIQRLLEAYHYDDGAFEYELKKLIKQLVDRERIEAFGEGYEHCQYDHAKDEN